jgi:DNA-binding NarL/FixJ family response regulator
MKSPTNDELVKRILVVDDHILFREGLISLLNSHADFEVVGGAGSVHEGIEKARQLQPDIVLMDFSLPDGTGLDATSVILAELPACRIVFLTVYETDEKLFSALRLGAKGYMLKNIASTNLISSLRALYHGELAMSRQMMSRALDEFVQAPRSGVDKGNPLIRLTSREVDVLRELGDGASNQEIAKRLYLSENTVKHHIRNVFDKLGLNNRREAASVARQAGLKSRFSGLEFREEKY